MNRQSAFIFKGVFLKTTGGLMKIQNLFYQDSKNSMRWLSALVAITLFFISGCTNMGPKTVARDRFNYNTAISDSWKEQTLLNIVKLRYADMPLFVEVASIVSGYTLEGSVSLGGNASTTGNIKGDLLSVGTSGKYTDRPTITYVPITGQKFNASFMTPIPPRVILFLMQSGWPIDVIFPLTVDAVNGLRSDISGGANQRAGDSGFYRVIALLRKIQKSGAVGMKIIKKGEDDSTVMFFYQENITPEIAAAFAELRQLLGLQPGVGEMTVSYGFLPANNQEMAMLTRSMMQIMVALSTQITVPPEHVADGRTVASLSSSKNFTEDLGQFIKISSSTDKPENAYTAVKYKEHWFWVDDRDFKSKRAFAFLMILFSLTESGGQTDLPLVTIPAG
jgi:hypothetical protein